MHTVSASRSLTRSLLVAAVVAFGAMLPATSFAAEPVEQIYQEKI